jgi:hypothetical protein
MKQPIEKVNNSKAFKAKLKELASYDKKIKRKSDPPQRDEIVAQLLDLHSEELMTEAFLLGYKQGYEACKKLNKGKPK